MSEQIVRVRQVMKTDFDTVDSMTTVFDALKSMRHIETVKPEMDIRYCARLFDRFELSRAPVAEDGKVVGIVSFTDMVLRGLLPE